MVLSAGHRLSSTTVRIQYEQSCGGGGELHVTHTPVKVEDCQSNSWECSSKESFRQTCATKVKTLFQRQCKHFHYETNECDCTNSCFSQSVPCGMAIHWAIHSLPKTCHSLDSNLKPSTNRPPLLHIPTHCTNAKFLDASGKFYRSKYRKAVYILFLPSWP